MRPRLEPVAFDATKPTHALVELPRGAHQFRLPVLSVQYRITELHEDTRTGDSMPMSKALERAAVAIGASWFHEFDELEAVYPEDDSTPSMVRYARDVQRELEDAGYAPSEILCLGSEVLQLMRKRIAEDAKAVELADFFAARQVAPSTP